VQKNPHCKFCAPLIQVNSMSKDLEIDQLRFRVKTLESQLSQTQVELEEKRRICVNLAVELKRQMGQENKQSNSRTTTSIPSIKGMDLADNAAVPDDLGWDRLRADFLSVMDELSRTRASLKQSDETLREERERRSRDAENMRRSLREKENEIANLKMSFDSQLKRSVELEDRLAKSRPPPQAPVQQLNTARSQSPDMNYFSRNYFPTPTMGTSASLGPPTIPTYASPVLMSRQILQSSPSQSYHVYRRGSN
jgi:hypothetical protein